MDVKDTIKEEIIDWIKTFVEVPHPLWGDLPPCPYARTARIENNELDIQVQEEEDYYELLEKQIESFADTDFDVILVIAKDKNDIDSSEYTAYIEKQNQELIQHGLVLLTDHPDIIETNHGVSVQQGTYVITFIQRIKNLVPASKNLHANTTYYDKWEADFYKEVVLDRYDKWETYKDGPTDGPVVEHEKPSWMKQK